MNDESNGPAENAPQPPAIPPKKKESTSAAHEFNPVHLPATTVSTHLPDWDSLPIPGAGGLSEAEDKNWGMFCHLAMLAGVVIPFGNIFGPLVVWLIKKEESPFVDAHGKESLNFQISVTLYTVAGGIFSFFATLLLFLFFPLFFLVIIAVAAISVFALVYTIIATIRASEGGFLRYPLTIRFIR